MTPTSYPAVGANPPIEPLAASSPSPVVCVPSITATFSSACPATNIPLKSLEPENEGVANPALTNRAKV